MSMFQLADGIVIDMQRVKMLHKYIHIVRIGRSERYL